jgi:polar amino acid transport system substrate-binding protein
MPYRFLTYAMIASFIAICFTPFANNPAHGEEWIMSVQQADLSPFKHRKNKIPSGINVDLMYAIAQKVNIPLLFRDFDVNEGRQHFLLGDVNIDCCLNAIWFPDSETTEVQLFSAPLYRLMETWVFPKNQTFKFDSVKELKTKRVVGIKGFHYPGEEYFGSRLNGETPLDVLQILLNGQADIAILERHVASYLINKKKLEAEFGTLYYTVDVSVRLHKSLAHHMPAINKAIAALKKDGTVKTIIDRNLF